MRTILVLVIAEPSEVVKVSYAHQQEKQISASADWTHSDVYETKLLKDGETHLCTIASKGDELLVTIEGRKPIKESLTSDGKTENMVVSGSIHKFKMNKTDGSMSDLLWLAYGETDKGQRFTNRAKAGPSTKSMLEPFKGVLQKLPPEIYTLLERY